MSTNKCLIAIFGVLLVGCAACATVDEDPSARLTGEQLRGVGEKFLTVRDFGQSLRFLSMAEKKLPNDPAVQYDLGLAFDERGIPAEAIVHFQKALTLKPDYSDAQNALGRTYAKQGEMDKAQECFEKALADPFYGTPYLALYNLGLVYEKKEDLDTALKQYQEATRLQPSYGPAYYRMGQVLELLKRLDEARRAYGKAIEYSPDLVEAHLRYGVLCYMAGDLENTLYSLNRVVKLSPHSPMAEEARKYLDRLQSIIGGTSSRSASIRSSARMANVEIVSEKDLVYHESGTVSPRESKDAGTGEESLQAPKDIASVAASAKQKKGASKTSDVTNWTYIVQLGSFVDKENAEEFQKKLESRGYEAVIKPFNHQVLGRLYVVQLKPVDDAEKASTLMTQIESQENLKPVMIKVPSNINPAQ